MPREVSSGSNAAEEREPIRWIDPAGTPWPVPVLDVRPITLTMQSYSEDRQMAANAVSFGHDDGLSFIDQRPPVDRTVQLALRYRVDPMLADGALFLPKTMEHKWAVFHHAGRLLFVRSWQRRVVVTAHTTAKTGWVEVVDAQGVFSEADEPPTFTEAVVDFIIRTHALHLPHPAPLATDPGDDLGGAALWSFSMFGNLAHFATPHRFSLLPPDVPLRSFSLLHIAVARGDLAAAQAQLDLGVPVGLLAGDGSTAMQWALGSGHIAIMAWLLERGLSVDARNDNGTTSLMNAVQGNNLEAIAWLLDQGADPNAADDRSFTCLHRAAEAGFTEIVHLLLQRGAALSPIAQGQTPLSLAEASGHSEIIGLLGR